jgi:hypothetical protein
MVEEKEKKFYILGKVVHQDDTDPPTELLGDADTIKGASDRISNIMNQSFPPKGIFVIEGVKRKVNIKGVSIE